MALVGGDVGLCLLVVVGGCWWLLVVVGGWWWLLVVGGGWWWLVVVGSGWWWLVVVGGGRWWLVVVGGGRWWLVVVCSGWWCLVALTRNTPTAQTWARRRQVRHALDAVTEGGMCRGEAHRDARWEGCAVRGMCGERDVR